MDRFLVNIASVISHEVWIAPVFAILAGVLVSFTPCSLSTMPLIIGYVGGSGESDTKKAFKLSLIFAIGMTMTFTALGLISALIGKMALRTGKWWFIFLGILMILMALQTYEVITIIKPTYLQTKNKRKGYIGALLTGILAGFFSSPCATPVLVAILALVSNSSNVWWGAFLLLLYAIGNSVLVIVVGTFMGTASKITKSKQYGKVSTIIKYFLGTVILILGLYLLYLGF